MSNKKKRILEKSFIILFFFVVLLNFAYAITITPSSSMPSDGSSIRTHANFANTTLNYSLSFNGLTTINYSDGYTNFSFWDDNLLMGWNFDNVSNYGETQTVVKDIGKYGHNLTMTTGTQITANGRFGFGVNSTNTATSMNAGIGPEISNSTVFSGCQWFNFTTEVTDTVGVLWRFRNNTNRSNELIAFIRNETTENQTFRIEIWNNAGNAVDNYLFTPELQRGVWHHLCWSVNNTWGDLYLNGELIDTVTLSSVNLSNDGDRRFYFDNDFIGTLDEVFIWNKNLRSEDARLIYESYFKKENSTAGSWYINKSIEARTYNLRLCGSDGDSSSCSLRTIYSDVFANINVSYNTALAMIYPYFYGTNTHGLYLGEGTTIRPYGNSTTTASDLTWHRQTFLDSGMNYVRWDSYLGSFYRVFPQIVLDGEMWVPNNIGYTCSSSCSNQNFGTIGWQVETSGGAQNITANRSSDAYMGSYSINLTANNSAGSGYLEMHLGKLPVGTYNFSWTAKTYGSNFRFNVQNVTSPSYTNLCYMIMNVSGWNNYSCSFTIIDGHMENNRITIDTDTGLKTMLIDNVRITKDNKPYNYTRDLEPSSSTNMTSRKEQIEWLSDNGIKSLHIASYMPPTLANYTNTGCNYTNYNGGECGAVDYSLWQDILVDYIDYMTDNGTDLNGFEVEVWNEPDIWFFLENLPTDHINKSYEYINLYNATWYAVKNNFNGIPVIAGGLAGVYRYNMTNTILSNFSNRIDGFSFHRYSNTQNTTLLSDMNVTNYYCNLYNANCSRILYTEWNMASGGYANTNLNNKIGLAKAYLTMFNTFYYRNITSIIYQWSEQYVYNSTSGYPEYPAKWHMVLEDDLNNGVADIRESYNITQLFSSYAPSGSNIYNFSSDYNYIEPVFTKNGNNYYLTVLNNQPKRINLSINSGGTLDRLTDSTTGTTYYEGGSQTSIYLESYGINGFYYYSAINENIANICNTAGRQFQEAITLVGLILSIVLIGSVVGILLLSYNGMIDVSSISINPDFDWKSLVGVVLVVGFTALLIATLAFIINGSYCPAIGG